MGSPVELERWLKRHGLSRGSGRFRVADISRLHGVREALRAVLAAHNGGAAPPPGAVDLLNTEGRRVCLHALFSDAGIPSSAAGGEGVAGLIASVLRSALAGAERGMWERLKACPECGWVFYDHSRNRRGSWCTMAICGSRAKMRAYRRRRAESVSASAHPG